MNDFENLRIFTETTESMGTLYESYKDLSKIVSNFLDKVESNINSLLKDPTNVEIDLKDEINNFKKDIDKKFTPSPININNISSTKKMIKTYRSEIDKILDKLAKMKNKTSFGGNFIRSIALKPKVYSKEIDNDNYDIINKNIRNVDRALDWIEKIVIDLYNMIDQDLNILTIVDKVYAKKHIYECGIIEGTSGILGDDLDWVEQYLMEEGETFKEPPSLEPEDSKKQSMPKQTDAAEADKNGVRRKKLYIAFIEWCKEYNSKNTFGSIFDKDAFKISYPFVPNEMRYFYRLANPMLCVLSGDLTFFPVAELRKLNSKNSKLTDMMIFAATPNDMRVFNNKDKKVYRGTDENGALTLHEILGDTFDTYIQKMINQGDILNAPIEESVIYDDIC